MNYDTYKMTKKDLGAVAVKSLLLTGAIGYLFYSSFWVLAAAPAAFILVCKMDKQEKIMKQKKELQIAFKEVLRAISANLTAGYSAENAFRESYADISRIYGKDTLMAKELYLMIQKLGNNAVLESLIADLGDRSGIEDIRDFGEVFAIAKRSGGDITGVLKNCSDVIREKMEVEREIATLLTAKQFEQKVMNMVPFLIIAYVRVSSKGMLDGLYHNLAGVMIMTLCLGVYTAAFFLARKIVNIKV